MKEMGAEGGKDPKQERKKLVNLAAFGAWSQLLGTDEASFALQIVGQLISKERGRGRRRGKRGKGVWGCGDVGRKGKGEGR